MKKLHKNWLIFSIVFWLLVVVGLILTGYAMQKVPIGFYGLKVHYFSSDVNNQYYTNGLYHTGVGYYFVLYPQAREYMLDRQVAVINKDLQKITVKYTLSYRINPSGILSMYYSLAGEYQEHLIAIINNIVSSVFSTLSQVQSRVSAQEAIVSEYNSNGKGRVDTIFGKGIIVEAIWVNKLDFSSSQTYYDSAYIYSSASSSSYQAAGYNLTIAKLQLNAVNSAIKVSKQGFIKGMQLEQQKSYDQLTIQAISSNQNKILNLSQQYNVSRVLNVIVFVIVIVLSVVGVCLLLILVLMILRFICLYVLFSGNICEFVIINWLI